MYCDIAVVCLFGCLLDKPWHNVTFLNPGRKKLYVCLVLEGLNALSRDKSLTLHDDKSLALHYEIPNQTRRTERVCDFWLFPRENQPLAAEDVIHVVSTVAWAIFCPWADQRWLWCPVMNISIEKCFDGTLLLFRCCSRRSSLRVWVPGSSFIPTGVFGLKVGWLGKNHLWSMQLPVLAS
jgi:hypothetical protein